MVPHLGVPELDLGHWARVVPFVQLLSRILAKHLIRLNGKLKGEKVNHLNLVGPLQNDALNVVLQDRVHLMLTMSAPHNHNHHKSKTDLLH